MLSCALAGAMVAVAAGRTVPQHRRLARTGALPGTSPSAVLLYLAASVVWLAYQLAAGVWVAVAAQVLAVIVLTATAVRLARLRLLPARSLVAAGAFLAGYGVVAVAGARFGSATAWVGTALVAATLAYGAPALVAGLAARDLSGLSPLALGITQVDAVIAAVVWIGCGDPAYVAYAVLQTVCTLPVLLRVARQWARRTSVSRFSTYGVTSATVMARPASCVRDVTVASLMPHGTMRSYHDRSASQLRAKPCMVTPCETRMPIAATLRSCAPSCPSTQTPERPWTRVASTPRSAHVRISTSSTRRTCATTSTGSDSLTIG